MMKDGAHPIMTSKSNRLAVGLETHQSLSALIWNLLDGWSWGRGKAKKQGGEFISFDNN
jgi:hypothetical protein